MKPSEVKEYWERRLEKDFGLDGVGYTGISLGFNRWMYKIRRVVFLRKVRRYVPVTAQTRVLDIGCGTGFYIDRWVEAGVKHVTGLDITDTVVANCSKKYPAFAFKRQDIGDESLAAGLGTFDAVSAFDVLFHIVDERRFANALRNIASLCRPGAVFMMSDNFLHCGRASVKHQVSRTLKEIEQGVVAAGFDIVERRPMQYLMNDPVDGNTPLVRLCWRFVSRIAARGNAAGAALGLVLFPLELALTLFCRESPTTEILVCRKRGSGKGANP